MQRSCRTCQAIGAMKHHDDSNENDGRHGNDDQYHDRYRERTVPSSIDLLYECLGVAGGESNANAYAAKMRHAEEEYRKLCGKLFRATSDGSNTALTKAPCGLIPLLLDQASFSKWKRKLGQDRMQRHVEGRRQSLRTPSCHCQPSLTHQTVEHAVHKTWWKQK